MNMRALLFVPCLLVGALSAAPVDPFQGNPEIQAWAQNTARLASSSKGRLQALVASTFRPVAEGGLGMVYDNSRTRTVQEVWQEHQANCISLTAFFITACRYVGIEAQFAEPVRTNHWRRVGNVVRVERHLVALASLPQGDVVADFLPTLRERNGVVFAVRMTDSKARALFYSNLAVECLDAVDLEGALRSSEQAIQEDARVPSAWNVRGVILREAGHVAEAEGALKKALALDARDGAAIGNMEALLRDAGRFEEAAKYRELGLKAREKDPYFNAFLADEAFREGRLEEAKDRIQTAIKLQPYDPEFHLTMAKVRMAMGQIPEARKAIENGRRWALPEERERYDNKLALLAKL